MYGVREICGSDGSIGTEVSCVRPELHTANSPSVTGVRGQVEPQAGRAQAIGGEGHESDDLIALLHPTTEQALALVEKRDPVERECARVNDRDATVVVREERLEVDENGAIELAEVTGHGEGGGEW
jgi:predicted transcriptional regulator